MKRNVMAVAFPLLLLLLQACSGDPGKKLHGLWRCDGKATFALMEASRTMTTEQIAAGAAVLENMLIEIDGDAETITLSLGPSVEQYPYALTEDGNNVFTMSYGRDAVRFELRDGKTLLLRDSRLPQNITLVFTRK